MPSPDITLTAAEQLAFADIVLDPLAIADGQGGTRANGLRVQAFLRALQARKGVPQHRIDYLTRADHNIGGRGASRVDIFVRNGTGRDQISQHPHFLKYLQYLVCGPDLPPDVKAVFAAEVAACDQVTSSDIEPLRICARRLTREHHLDPRRASEEFFKLALDLGFGPDRAAFIRDTVRTVR